MWLHSMADIASRQYSHLRARRMLLTTAFAALALCQAPAFWTSHAHAAEGGYSGFPFLVRCEVSGVNHFFYLTRIRPDGVAIYLTPDRQGGTISIDGTAKRIIAGTTGNCAGKTLEQLRSAAQVYDLK